MGPFVRIGASPWDSVVQSEETASSMNRPVFHYRWTAPPTVVALLTALLTLTWGTWPDPIVDFGRELYTPWRLSQGAVLYRDVAWINGPLSPYVNAVVFCLFGASLRTLVLTNVALLGVLSIFLYRVMAAISTRRLAVIAVGTFLSLFAFSQLTEFGNYNFVCPYSHEITHGVLLAIATVYVMHSWLRRGRPLLAFVAGLLTGMALLTKPETAIAALAVVVSYFACGLLSGRLSAARAWAPAMTVLIGLAVPVALAVTLLSSALGLNDTMHALATPWRGALNPNIQSLPFYRLVTGFDEPLAHAVRVLEWAGIYVAAAISILLIGRLLRSTRAAAAWSEPLAASLAFGVFALSPYMLPLWYEGGRGLPVVCVIGAVIGIIMCSRQVHAEQGAVLCAFSLLSLALLSKILLAAKIYSYGFALGLPATLLLVLFFVGYLPRIGARLGTSTRVVERASVGLLAGGILVSVAITLQLGHTKTMAVGTGFDRFRADARGGSLEQCRIALQPLLPPGASVAVLPEGVMLNYLLRRPSSVPYINFMPVELLLFGENAIVSALRASPPDVIVLIHRETREYGYPLFGSDYGMTIMKWVKENYRRSLLIGDEPLRTRGHFGIEILRRASTVP